MDQNNIILVLLLIAVLVAFYSIYLGMENSKKIKKINIEMIDIVKLVQDSSNLKKEPMKHPEKKELNLKNLDEYPTMEEINLLNAQLNNEQPINDQPLDENLKHNIDNLDSLNDDELLLLEKKLDLQESNEEVVETHKVESNEEVVETHEVESNEEVLGGEVLGGEVVETHEVESNEEVVETHEVESNEEVLGGEVLGGEVLGGEVVGEEVLGGEVVGEELESNGKYMKLSNLTEEKLNELNCDDLRDICKREELRTRGKKSELVERIIKKKEAFI